MKVFRKLALVSAIATLPATGFAMQAMDDAALSGVTGQDGITIGLNLNANLDIGIEDTSGFSGVTGPGLLMLDNFSLVGDVDITIDSASNANGGVLRIGLDVPSLTVNTGDIYVGTGTDGTSVAAGMANLTSELGTASAGTALIDSVSVTLTDLDLGIELGAGASNFLSINTTSVLNIDIGTLNDTNDNFTLRDQSAAGGGEISIDQIAIQNVDLNGLTASLTTNGLEISTNAALAGMNVAMMDVGLGAGSLGNVYIQGLNMSNQTITISGH